MTPVMCRLVAWLGILFSLGTSACSSEESVCPGHVDPMGPSQVQIQTSDGSASIAAVKVIEGGCSVYLPGVPDASPGVRWVTVSRGYVDKGAPCLLEIVAVNGNFVVVTAAATYQNLGSGVHCTGNANCCPKSGLETYSTSRWEFTQKVIQVSFGADVSAGYDAGVVDGNALDGGLD
jgi:hypothetical protein